MEHKGSRGELSYNFCENEYACQDSRQYLSTDSQSLQLHLRMGSHLCLMSPRTGAIRLIPVGKFWTSASALSGIRTTFVSLCTPYHLRLSLKSYAGDVERFNQYSLGCWVFSCVRIVTETFGGNGAISTSQAQDNQVQGNQAENTLYWGSHSLLPAPRPPQLPR